jgi:hypothetical protein
MRDVTPAQARRRDDVVQNILGAARQAIFSAAGVRLGHLGGPWRAFDNVGMLQTVYADTRASVLELRIGVRDAGLARPHVDDVLIAACGVARRGLHDQARSVDVTLRSARTASAELASWREAGYGDAFDAEDERVVYEAIAAQAAIIGPAQPAHPAVGHRSKRMFPGGHRHLLVQQILADGTTRWLAGRECLWWVLMHYVQSEVAAERLQETQDWLELARAEGLQADQVVPYLREVADRIAAHHYYVPVVRKLLERGLTTNHALVIDLARRFEADVARGTTAARAFFGLLQRANGVFRGHASR